MQTNLQDIIIKKLDRYKDTKRYLEDPTLPSTVTFINRNLPRLSAANPILALEVAGACVRISRNIAALQQESLHLWRAIVNDTQKTYPLDTFNHLRDQATHESSNAASVQSATGFWRGAVQQIFERKPRDAIGIAMYAVDITQQDMETKRESWKNILKDPEISGPYVERLKKIGDFQKIALDVCGRLAQEFLLQSPKDAIAVYGESYVHPNGKNPYGAIKGLDLIKSPALRQIAANSTLLWRKEAFRPEALQAPYEIGAIKSL